MSELDLYFGVGALIAGVYCIYQAIKMKKTGIICATLLLDSQTKMMKCKNIGEFLSRVIMPTMVLGIVLLLYGVVTMVDLYLYESDLAVFAVMALTMGALIWFAVVTNKAKKEYY